MPSEFKPTRLMIKRHLITGLRYFCKSYIEKYEQYKGSGKHWERHIKKHGTNHVITEWASEPFTDPKDIEEFALLFSELHNIVKSKQWANMKPEDGLTGGGPGPGKEGAKKLRATFNDPVWKATTGKLKAEKALAGFIKTTSDPEWKATTGAKLAKNASERFKDVPKSENHRANIKKAQELNGGNGPEKHTEESKAKTRATMADPVWQATILADANKKRSATWAKKTSKEKADAVAKMLETKAKNKLKKAELL
jgi:hypothetical protein